MGDEPTTTLTVAKLKALCVLNDVSASGKKAELLARLLEAGVDKVAADVDQSLLLAHANPDATH